MLSVRSPARGFGTREEVSKYRLSDRIEILWLEDGDHDLKPRKRILGITTAEHLQTLAGEVRAWADRTAAYYGDRSAHNVGRSSRFLHKGWSQDTGAPVGSLANPLSWLPFNCSRSKFAHDP